LDAGSVVHAWLEKRLCGCFAEMLALRCVRGGEQMQLERPKVRRFDRMGC
jgi:hypothetical protein